MDGRDMIELASSSAPRRILVVDDVESNRELLRRWLARSGYDVEEASDGYEALLAVEQDVPDLMLLDLHMPNLDGHETLRRVRNAYNRDLLPIIVVTADQDERVAANCLEAGANDFITKPIMWPLLRARVTTFLINRSAKDDAATH
jgi:CheY-like chemotaxis protein